MVEASLQSLASCAAPSLQGTSEAMSEPRVQPAQEALCLKFKLGSVRTHVRVLHIQKANGTEYDPIVAKMKVIDIVAERNRYNALSYVWGSGFEPESVICDGWTVPVHKNCYSAMYHLRRKLGSFDIWIDALCINQDQRCAENQSQIHLMTEIYANANSVYIWLGTDTPSKRSAMAFFRRACFKDYLKGGKSSKKYERRWAAAYMLACRTATWPFPSRMRPNASTILPLLDDLWLRRMWTYQEMLFANQPIIVCGEHHIEWHTFQDGLLRLSMRRDGEIRERLCNWLRLGDSRDRSISTYLTCGLGRKIYAGTRRHARLREVVATWLGLGDARQRMAIEHETFTLHEKREFLKSVLNRSLFLQLAAAVLLMLSTVSNFAKRLIAAAPGNSATNTQSTVGLGPYGTAAIVSLIASVVITGIVLLGRLRQAFQDGGGVSTAGAIAEGVYHRDATKPIDKAYAVWNILRKLGVRGLPHETEVITKSKLYRHLAASLLESTGDLDVLRFAVVSPLPTEDTDVEKVPTWVPDWAPKIRRELEVERHRVSVDMEGYPMFSELHASLLRTHESETNKAYLDSARALLTVSARPLGVVSGCIPLFGLSKAFTGESLNEYVRSVQAAVDFVRVLRALDITFDQVLASVNTDCAIGRSEQSNWLKVMTIASATGTEKMLTQFLDPKELPSRSVGFLSTHNIICKLLGESGYVACKIRFFRSSDDEVDAICRGTVQKDDLILRIRGVLQPLVVRRSSQNDLTDKSVALVSALTMDARQLEAGSLGDLPGIEQVVIR